MKPLTETTLLELDQVETIDLESRYDGLIFDCDGTLTDSMPLHYVAWRETMERYGIQFPETRFYAMGGMPSDLIISILGEEQGVSIDVRRAALEKEQAFTDAVDQLQPLPRVCAIAQKHVDRLPMAVASGGMREVVKRQLQQLEIDSFFNTVVAAEDTERHKPEPDVFLEAARRLGVAPERCLVFEDAKLGFQAAHAAGMDCVRVLRDS